MATEADLRRDIKKYKAGGRASALLRSEVRASGMPLPKRNKKKAGKRSTKKASKRRSGANKGGG